MLTSRFGHQAACDGVDLWADVAKEPPELLEHLSRSNVGVIPNRRRVEPA